MINPAIAMLVARGRESDLLRDGKRGRAERASDADNMHAGTGRSSASAPGGGVLVARTRELVRLAASFGCGKDELVQLIKSV